MKKICNKENQSTAIMYEALTNLWPSGHYM